MTCTPASHVSRTGASARVASVASVTQQHSLLYVQSTYCKSIIFVILATGSSVGDSLQLRGDDVKEGEGKTIIFLLLIFFVLFKLLTAPTLRSVSAH